MTPQDHTDEQLAVRGGERVRAAAAGVSAPLALRERIEREREQAARPAARRRRRQLGGALAGVAAAAVLAVVLIGSSSDPTQPTVLQAAALGQLPATAAAPVRDPARLDDVAIREGNVQFPYWADGTAWHWRPSGVRTDTLGAHHATTVFYEARGVPLAYTVVDTPALNVPEGRLVDNRYTVLHHGGHNIVTWRAHGQTCIITAPSSFPAAGLVTLAKLDTHEA